MGGVEETIAWYQEFTKQMELKQRKREPYERALVNKAKARYNELWAIYTRHKHRGYAYHDKEERFSNCDLSSYGEITGIAAVKKDRVVFHVKDRDYAETHSGTVTFSVKELEEGFEDLANAFLEEESKLSKKTNEGAKDKDWEEYKRLRKKFFPEEALEEENDWIDR